MQNNQDMLLEKLVKGMYSEMLKLDDKAFGLAWYRFYKPDTKKAFLFNKYTAQAEIIEKTLVNRVKKKDWLRKEVHHNYIQKKDSWKETVTYFLPRFYTGTAQIKTPDDFWNEYKEVI